MPAPTDAYRFNWNTPFQLSPHNPSIIWLGGNRLFKSYNRGDTWIASADLTKSIDRNTVALMGAPGDRTQLSKNDGVVSYSTIVSISESPVMPGVVWAGTDDGNVQVSRDGGATFTEVGKGMPGLPADHQYWISRIDASHFDPGTAYVSVDGHRSDDLKPYLFVTRDYGRTWQSLVNNLPALGNIQVVREDPKNKDLLYVGTEFGLFISTDGGKQWQQVHEQPADRARRRHPRAPARRRSHRRDARARRLDRRRHHAAAAAAGGRVAGGGALRHPSGGRVASRSPARAVRRRAAERSSERIRRAAR